MIRCKYIHMYNILFCLFVIVLLVALIRRPLPLLAEFILHLHIIVVHNCIHLGGWIGEML